MNPEHFRNSPSGHLIPTIQGCFAFVPNPLPPPSVDLLPLLPAVARATHALGELSGIGQTLPNPFLLIRPFMRMEAIASSKIEGTVTTPSELFMLEVSDDAKARSDTREVRNYIRAMQHGLDRVKEEFPISRRLICEIHRVLMSDIAPHRGSYFTPGELKKNQNWIGARLIGNAKFVPPPPDESENSLSQLEKYINQQEDDVPLIIKSAYIHYQFEAIHPFPDGNGRIGRLLIPLLLYSRKELSHPMLYLSSFFETNYEKYIETMYEISRIGAWEAWVEFFLEGIEVTCRDAIKKACALQELHGQYRERVQEARSSALLAKLIDHLFNAPATTIPYAMKTLEISYNSAKANIKRLEELGIITEQPRSHHPKWFFATEIIDAVSGSPSKSG